MFNARFWTLVLVTLAAAATRLLPHPPNFAPIGAIALFGGAYFSSKRAAFAVPLVAMLISNALLAVFKYGGSVIPLMPWVYGSISLTVGLGLLIRSRRSPLNIAAASLTGSIFFFLITNFGVWLRGTRYEPSLEGLVICYTAAIPFFQNTLLGDAFYTLVLFGGFALAERRFAILREPNGRAIA